MNYKWVKIAAIPINGKPLIANNTVARLAIEGKVLYLANLNGQYYAGDARCPHAGGAIDKGWLDENGNIVCPTTSLLFRLANWTQYARRRKLHAEPYSIEEKEDGYFIGFPITKSWPW